ncbi:MAG TPA: hypothetical protein VLE73_01480 [Candidatus Saccharimonadales bacterium]|nr:hypothetical protein [Candidatus Saccharimonadales bacterium]
MQYPSYNGYPDRRKDIVGTYIQFIGENEPDNRPALEELDGQNSTMRASLLIGRSCLILVSGNDRAAGRMLHRAQRTLSPFLNGSEPRRRDAESTTAADLYNLATAIEERDDSTAFKHFQEQAHANAIRELGLQARQSRVSIASGREKGESIRLRAGRGAQQRVVAGLIRYAHPWLGVIPSLPHHDDTICQRTNYDTLVIESGPDWNNHPVTHKVQVKRDCLGFCGDQNGAIIGKQMRHRYARDIALVSDHCDTHARLNRKCTEHGLGIILRKELDGEATADDLRHLDLTTDHLVLAVTAPEDYRRGRKRPRAIPPHVIHQLPQARSTKIITIPTEKTSPSPTSAKDLPAAS